MTACVHTHTHTRVCVRVSQMKRSRSLRVCVCVCCVCVVCVNVSMYTSTTPQYTTHTHTHTSTIYIAPLPHHQHNPTQHSLRITHQLAAHTAYSTHLAFEMNTTENFFRTPCPGYQSSLAAVSVLPPSVCVVCRRQQYPRVSEWVSHLTKCTARVCAIRLCLVCVCVCVCV